MENLKIDHTWTLFLDRDGVINHRIMGGYVTSIDEFQFLNGVLDAMKIFKNTFSHVFVVTNQQGIAKNIMTERNLLEIHDYMCSQIEKAEGSITKCYFAPELKTDQNNTRKPKPNMALKAKQDFPNVDFQKSIMVGDTDSDIKFGMNLGMKTIRIKTVETINVEADFTFTSLKEFSDKLML